MEKFSPSGRSFFSSRLEYSNKWLPVGRGDPLKNDPTYDYSPPALDHRIRYWDEKSTKTNGNKNEILLLGVSSRRPNNHNFDRRHSDISTVLLPPPIQSMQTLNYKIESNYNRQPVFGMHKTWQEKLVDSMTAESNVQPTIVMPNPALMYHQHSNAEEVNKLSSHQDFHSPMYTKSGQSKKSWLQDLLQKEVAKPTTISHVQVEAVTMHKLNDINHFNVESMTEMTPPYFVPTINPSISNDNKVLFKEIPKPMNLIIQGHSRVKTYGQGTDERDPKNPKIIEVKSVEDPVVNRVVSKDENGVQFDVKHLHSSNKTQNHTTEEYKSKNSSVAGLLSLLDLSFGEILDNSSNVRETKSNEIKML